MMNITSITTIRERPVITKQMIRWTNKLKETLWKEHDIWMDSVWILDADDPYLEQWKHMTDSPSNYNIIVEKGTQLSSKMLLGMERIQGLQFDYMIHMDSDEFISPRLFSLYQPLINKGVPFFGSLDKFIFDLATEKLWRFSGYASRPMTVNGGRMISREALENVQFRPWTPGLSFGLNYNEKLHLQSAGFKETQLKTCSKGCVVEVKGEDNIHGMDWFMKNTPSRIHDVTDKALEILPGFSELFIQLKLH